jgi:hypothetical protein
MTAILGQVSARAGGSTTQVTKPYAAAGSNVDYPYGPCTTSTCTAIVQSDAKSGTMHAVAGVVSPSGGLEPGVGAVFDSSYVTATYHNGGKPNSVHFHGVVTIGSPAKADCSGVYGECSASLVITASHNSCAKTCYISPADLTDPVVSGAVEPSAPSTRSAGETLTFDFDMLNSAGYVPTGWIAVKVSLLDRASVGGPNSPLPGSTDVDVNLTLTEIDVTPSS